MKDGAQRLHSLDALRGIAALAVVLWHWQHFSSSIQQPFYAALKIFYDHGAYAVDLFFTLSGFIFFWLYARHISAGSVRAGQFFVLRLSRLYPLHLLTLLLVAAGQVWYTKINGSSFVYPYNDAYHFILNIFLLPSVGLERGYSFNAPVWSVSVEVVLYALFFAICRFRMDKAILLLAASATGFALVSAYQLPLGQGLASFFLGGLAHHAFAGISRMRQRNLPIAGISAVAAALWLITLFFVYTGKSPGDLYGEFKYHYATIVLFPITILSLALLDQKMKFSAKGLSFLGEISYSSYLLHFPLQLAFVLVADAIGLQANFFGSGICFALYFAILLSLSVASFRYIERPAQLQLRRRWLEPR